MKNDLINGRTPEEIKRVLEWATCACGNMVCEECQYYGSVCSSENFERIAPDALALIEHLEAQQPKWISVEERLPESGTHVLVCCERTGYMGHKTQYVCDGFYAGKYKVKVGWRDEDTAAEYSEEDDEFYLEEGWYEVIKNWGDYDSVVIDDRPTHWMPLPEPPKEVAHDHPHTDRRPR